MEYIYADKRNYEDYASGRVLYNQHGATSFPARLATEIFSRCKSYLEKKGIKSPYTIFDPCCGGGYLVTTLGFIHRNEISRIYASDIDNVAIELAIRNLELLNEIGLNSRINQLSQLYKIYQKNSHQEAIISANRLLEIVKNQSRIETQCFQSDIFSFNFNKNILRVDIVIVDVPYGNIVKWHSDEGEVENKFMNSIRTIIPKNAILAIVSDKKQRFNSTMYKRLEHFKVGLRQVSIFESI